MKKKIFCTLGPSTLNKTFLKYADKKVNLLRLNMSHIDIKDLQKHINFIKRYSKVKICIDTEGAQIRSKVQKEKIFKKKEIIKIYKSQKNKFCLYPDIVFNSLKKKDILDIGFEGLKVQIKNIANNKCVCKVIETGKLENNKGIYITNRKIKLKYLTFKDLKAIEIAKKNHIKHFALSFVNSHKDIISFNKILKKQIKIFKIETKSAIKDLNKIIKFGDNFLIDRGDLSKEIGIENIPLAQRQILKLSNKRKKNVYIATNFLESMISKNAPTRAEVNDIYNALELGAKGIVLAAETAIGNYPHECIDLLRKVFKIFEKN